MNSKSYPKDYGKLKILRNLLIRFYDELQNKKGNLMATFFVIYFRKLFL